MRFFLNFLIGFLVLGFIQDAFAFDCATYDPERSRYQPIVQNSIQPCLAGQSTIMSGTEYAQFQQVLLDVAALQASSNSSASTFDPVLAGSLWMFALAIILGCWVLAKNAGMIIDIIKRW